MTHSRHLIRLGSLLAAGIVALSLVMTAAAQYPTPPAPSVAIGDTCSPVITGKTNKTSGTVTIFVEPDITLVVPVNPDGTFSAKVDRCLPNGTYRVFLDGALVGTFTVSVNVPAPPAAGTGIMGGNGEMDIVYAVLAILAASVVIGGLKWAQTTNRE
jgi:hypothetical protein